MMCLKMMTNKPGPLQGLQRLSVFCDRSFSSNEFLLSFTLCSLQSPDGEALPSSSCVRIHSFEEKCQQVGVTFSEKTLLIFVSSACTGFLFVAPPFVMLSSCRSQPMLQSSHYSTPVTLPQQRIERAYSKYLIYI